MNSTASGKKIVGSKVKELLLSILGISVLYAVTLAIVGKLLEWQIAVGGAFAVIYLGFTCYLGILDLRSKPSIKYSAWKAIRIFILLLLIGATLFGVISFILSTYEWAEYQPDGASYFEFVIYYFMKSVDALPGLEVSETMDLVLPIEPKGAAAGVPVVFFRAVVILGIIAAFTKWWKNRGRNEDAKKPNKQ